VVGGDACVWKEKERGSVRDGEGEGEGGREKNSGEGEAERDHLREIEKTSTESLAKNFTFQPRCRYHSRMIGS